jgi:tRNA/tmRNA/rRNA uracil-C5-methylase (TrmA/RlmC/RlmD family)
MKGAILIDQLSHDNKNIPVRQNSAMKRIREAVSAINLLSERNIRGEEAIEALGQQFISDMENIEKEIEKIEDKLGQFNQIVKFDRSRDDNLIEAKSLQIEYSQLKSAYKDITTKLSTVDFIQEKSVDRTEDKEL